MTALAGIALEHPLVNAAGTGKSLADVTALARSAVAAVMVGSITLEPRGGNQGDVYHFGDGFSLNALGLPNRGLAYYEEQLPAMAALAHDAGKPLIVSIAGFAAAEYATVAERVAAGGADLLELNLACPNVWDGGAQKRIACFDTEQTAAICTLVSAAVAGGPPFGIKVSPFSDPTALADLATVVTGLAAGPGGPRFVTAVNTLPNALAFDAGHRPVTSVPLAGLAGPALKPVALGQLRQWRDLLPSTVDLVGAGGVSTGRDLADHLAAGAGVVQAATAFWNRDGDPSVFGEILAGWA